MGPLDDDYLDECLRISPMTVTIMAVIVRLQGSLPKAMMMIKSATKVGLPPHPHPMHTTFVATSTMEATINLQKNKFSGILMMMPI